MIRTDNLTNDQIHRIATKCIQIFSCQNAKGNGESQKRVYKFLERILPDNWSLAISLYETHVIPTVRERFFNGMGVDEFVSKALEIYRKTHSLEQIWHWLDNEWPLDADEYYSFVELVEIALSHEPKAPTKADWEELNEWLL